jgi:hypothetical protein
MTRAEDADDAVDPRRDDGRADRNRLDDHAGRALGLRRDDEKPRPARASAAAEGRRPPPRIAAALRAARRSIAGDSASRRGRARSATSGEAAPPARRNGSFTADCPG